MDISVVTDTGMTKTFPAECYDVQNSEVGDALLLVADDELIRTTMCRLMRQVAIDVIAVGTVKEAVAALSQIPAVVILDLVLADGSGMEVLKRIREANFGCKVAVVSGRMDVMHLNEVCKARPDAVFPKPLNFEDFTDWLCETFPEPHYKTSGRMS